MSELAVQEKPLLSWPKTEAEKHLRAVFRARDANQWGEFSAEQYRWFSECAMEHLSIAVQIAGQVYGNDEGLAWIYQVLKQDHWEEGMGRPVLVDNRYINPRIREFVMQRDGYACVICGSQEELHVDHIIPYSAGGPNHARNLRVLCRDHNLQKGAAL